MMSGKWQVKEAGKGGQTPNWVPLEEKKRCSVKLDIINTPLGQNLVESSGGGRVAN